MNKEFIDILESAKKAREDMIPSRRVEWKLFIPPSEADVFMNWAWLHGVEFEIKSPDFSVQNNPYACFFKAKILFGKEVASDDANQ